MKKRLIVTLICAMWLTVPVLGAPKVDMETYEKDGKKYIEKTYVIDVDEDISDVADGTFELDGYSYSQIDIKSEPIVETEKKEVEQPQYLRKVLRESIRQLVKPLNMPMKTGFMGI